MRDAPVEAGEILAGKYRVERVLGTGAMGVVVAADHLALGQRVALKFMSKRGTAEREERFLREARVAAMLRSQHVCKVQDVGTLENGAPYIVMDLLEGQDLARVIRMRGALPIGEAVDYVLQACEPIAEAHAAGIVHRDLKPANLFLTRGLGGVSLVKVLDFGISKLIVSDLELTKTGDNIGTPLYMAPEQMRSARDVDGRVDVYSLGTILYELLTASTPFYAETFMALCNRLLYDPPTPIEQHRADLPPPLAAAVMRAVEKDPGKRWPDIESFAAAIAPYAAPTSVVLGPRGSMASLGPPALYASSAITGTAARRARSRSPFVLAGAAVGIGLAAAATLIAMNRRSAPPPARATATSAMAPVPPPPPVASAVPPPAPTLAPEPTTSATASAAPPTSALPKPSKRPSAKPAASVDYDQR